MKNIQFVLAVVYKILVNFMISKTLIENNLSLQISIHIYTVIGTI